MESKKVDVLVLGSGVVGISLALELQRAGRQVTIIDRGEPGFGCSYGNAGWITPCFSMPLPQPGMFWKSIGWLLNPESPLYIHPKPSYLLARWMLSFLFAMNEKRLRESVAVLAEISKYSLTFYQELAKKAPQTLDFRQNGLLMVSGTADGLRAAQTEMSLMSAHGIPGQTLTSDEILEKEPALKPGLRGGVYFPTEASAEPLEVVRTLVREFEAAGGKLLSRTEAYDFEFSAGGSGTPKIREVLTTRGRFAPELVVFALGSWSHALAKRLRVSVPILGGKGYSLIADDFAIKPKHSLMILERKLAVTPRAGSVRLAGTLELVDGDDSITPRRVQAILNGAQAHLHMTSSPEQKPTISEIWRGLRPCTPDGVPMVGYSKKWSNLFYSVGHQMLGLQSAPGSARLASDLIAGKSSITDPRPFRPERFE